MNDNLKKEVAALTGEAKAEETPTESAPKFLRTFGTDTAALQAGEQPDFTREDAFDVDRAAVIPTAPQTTTASERLVTGSSITPPIESAPPPPPPPLVPAPPPTPAPNVAEGIHTYKSDFAERLAETNASATTIIAAEEDRKPSTMLPKRQKRSGSIGYIIASIVLVLLGIGGATFAYYYTRPVAVEITPGATTPIFVDDSATVTGEGSALATLIMNSAAKELTNNGIRELTLTGATSTNIFLALMPNAPDILLRNINAAGGMAGIVNVNGTQSPFFILSVASYSDTFAGMLQWEPTMPESLSQLFPPYPGVGAATSTLQKVFPAPEAASGFVDESIANHSVRSYKDADGDTIVVYGYWDQGTLIIARDENAFAAIVNRLANSHTTQ